MIVIAYGPGSSATNAFPLMRRSVRNPVLPSRAIISSSEEISRDDVSLLNQVRQRLERERHRAFAQRQRAQQMLDIDMLVVSPAESNPPFRSA